MQLDCRETGLGPHAGVGAVIFKQDAVLLIRRGKAPYEGWWALPGGKVEPGEPVEDAVRRELGEETGIIAGNLFVSGAVDVIVHDNERRLKTHYVLSVFTGRAAGGEICAGDDASAARWVTPEALEDMDLVPGILVQIGNARQILALHCVQTEHNASRALPFVPERA
jgi:8-oxo-dGTP diphosphatase